MLSFFNHALDTFLSLACICVLNIVMIKSIGVLTGIDSKLPTRQFCCTIVLCCAHTEKGKRQNSAG